MVVAIDGPAGSGKSTIARRVAEQAGFVYINSGNFYRAITYAALRAGADLSSTPHVLEIAQRTGIELRNGRISVDSCDVEQDLHSDAVDEWVALHSAIPEIRDIVNSKLRQAVENLDAVVEGRDITTVVFPDAEVKIYLDASIEVRAQRRHDQGVSALSLEELAQRIAARDEIDRNKPYGSLRVSESALYLDASHLTIEEVCETVLRKIRKTT